MRTAQLVRPAAYAALSADSPRTNFNWLLKFVFVYKRAVILGIVSGIVAGIFTTLSAYYVGTIVDHIRHGVDLQQLAVDAVILLVLTIISIVAFYGQRYYSGQTIYAVNLDIRRVLFANMLTLEQNFYQHYAAGDLLSRAHNDVEMIWRFLMITLTRIGSAVVTLIATFVLLSLVNLPLTLAVFVILGISTAIQLRTGRILASLYQDVQTQAGTLAAMVQDATSGIQTIKTFGREDGVAREYRRQNLEFKRLWLRHKRRHEPIGMLPNTISASTTALVVLFGGILILNQHMTLGDFTRFLMFLGSITTVLLQIGTIYQRYQQALGALARLQPLMQTAAIKDHADAQAWVTPHGHIRLENVGVKIDDKWLLQDINLDISAGKMVALVGPTGSGKSLLVSLLARVIDATTGRVLLDGHDVRQLKLEDIRQHIAYVPQSTFLFSQPLHTNVRMGNTTIADEELDNALRVSRVSSDLPQLPHGLDTLVGERGVMLSGGQKQRVAIARAIARDPAILILDDSLSSVDTQTSAEILSELRHVLATRTSLVIAHRIATVKDADLIVMLEDGRIVDQGTHKELLARNPTYVHMVERELKASDLNHLEMEEGR